MDDNLYRAPEARLVDPVGTGRQFYVVAPNKFIVLFAATVGGYSLYWFYKNWALFKASRSAAIWPVPRAIFSLFFAHSLFSEVDGKLRASAIRHDWSPSFLATIFVVATLVNGIVPQLIGQRIIPFAFALFSYLSLVAIGWVLYRAQLAVNRAEDDPQGSSNKSYSFANVAWIAVGALLWMLNLFNVYVLFNAPHK